MKNKVKTIIFLFLLFIALYALRYTQYAAFAQHEGHQPEGSGLASDQSGDRGLASDQSGDRGLASDSQSHSKSHSQSQQMQQQTKEGAKAKKAAKQKDIYYCPMHPSYTSDRPGDCPICNMKLVKKQEAEGIEKGDSLEGREENSFHISPEKQQLIGVKTDKAAQRVLTKKIRTVGRVAFDPDLYKAQQEYIEALNTRESVKTSGQDEVVKRAEALVEAAKLKLQLQGLGTKQIEELEISRQNDQSLLISSADSASTWVYATVYEYELEWVKPGEPAVIRPVSYPDKEFKGTVVSIDPVFNAATRSVRARIKVDNQESLLKPDMYVDVEMYSELGEQLTIPGEAIMDSGLRKIVFLALDNGYFRPVEIKAGISNDDYVQVLEGLKEGDIVVVSGNFLIDSESKLKSALEGTGHQHGQ